MLSPLPLNFYNNKMLTAIDLIIWVSVCEKANVCTVIEISYIYYTFIALYKVIPHEMS